jgi:SPP1 gp7 family putative phage head morphogenesis protein
MVNQETIGDMVRRVRGRAIGGGRYAGGVMGTTTREATALVRTSVNQIANRAHQEVYKANSDITEQYRYVATLDARTTELCASLDGQVFKYGEGPEPPQHWGCRSTTVPIVDWEGMGLTPPPEGMRASAGGPVSAGTNYGQWLKGQDVAIQNRVLGVGKAKLFRDGKFTLDELVRRDGTVLTLDELKQKMGG